MPVIWQSTTGNTARAASARGKDGTCIVALPATHDPHEVHSCARGRNCNRCTMPRRAQRPPRDHRHASRRKRSMQAGAHDPARSKK